MTDRDRLVTLTVVTVCPDTDEASAGEIVAGLVLGALHSADLETARIELRMENP